MVVPVKQLDEQLIRDTFHYHDGCIYRIKNGRKCTHKRSDGYLVVQFMGQKYKIHKLVWILHHGNYPTGYELDHINGIRTDNRIENLRLVTHGDNMRNIRNTRGKYGHGISKCKNSYQVKFGVKGKLKYFGSTTCLQTARKMAKEALASIRSEITPVKTGV